ncbi:MAG: hypothetical protein ACRYFS_12155 [Janthinobacterium lividum]
MIPIVVIGNRDGGLKPSGDVVVNPDYLAVWTLQNSEAIQEGT